MLSHVTHQAGPSSRRPAGWLSYGLTVSASAALLAYSLHHLPPFAGHAVASIVTAVALTTLMTVIVASRPALKPRVETPVLVLSPNSELLVRGGDRDDLGFTAALHEEALPHGFFADLGPRFLRAYHRTYLDSPHGRFIVAGLEGHAIGFVAGAVDPTRHRRWLFRHHGLRLVLVGTCALAARPRAGLHFFRTRVQRYAAAWRQHRGRPSPDTSAPPARRAELSHLATSSGARGVGAGGALVRAFATSAKAAGADEVTLTTLRGPEGAGPFYRGRGWIQGEDVTFSGTVFEQWHYDLRGGVRDR